MTEETSFQIGAIISVVLSTTLSVIIWSCCYETFCFFSFSSALFPSPPPDEEEVWPPDKSPVGNHILYKYFWLKHPKQFLIQFVTSSSRAQIPSSCVKPRMTAKEPVLCYWLTVNVMKTTANHKKAKQCWLVVASITFLSCVLPTNPLPTQMNKATAVCNCTIIFYY